MRRDCDKTFRPADDRRRRRATGAPEAVRAIARGHANDRRAVLRDLLREQLRVLTCRKAGDLQPIGVRVYNRQRALADRAR